MVYALNSILMLNFNSRVIFCLLKPLHCTGITCTLNMVRSFFPGVLSGDIATSSGY